MVATAIADDFLGAYAKLPRSAQKKVGEFTHKFRRDPRAAAINYEPIVGARDSRLKSVRVGLAHRAVVLAPDKGSVYVLLWVDHHDEAYRWARDRHVDVHPATGALQIYETVEVMHEAVRQARASEPPPAVAPASPAADGALSGRFGEFSDEQLVSAGVPPVLLPAVRSVYSDDELEALAKHLPAEAGEVLTWLAMGLSLDEALEEVLADKPTPPDKAPVIDPDDLAAAILRPESGRRFRVMDREFDLETALAYPLDKWRVFLHPSQRKLVERSYKGAMRVLGAAGTGKTVVAMHRAVWLVRNVLTKADERLLFATFNVNLAADIESQLAKLATEDERKRIEVTNIDSLAHGIVSKADEDVRLALEHDQAKAWDEAVDAYGDGPWDTAFYRAEWRDVIQAQDIKEEAEYLKARRLGRGTKLKRIDRKKVWPVFERYRELIAERRLAESVDILRMARRHLEEQPSLTTYAAVVVDETQDMGAEALKLIRAIAGPEHADDLFLVGDAHQRIYGRPVALMHCGINVRGRRSRHLRVNYRTTDTIRRFSMRALEGESFDDLDEGKDDAKGYVSLRSGPAPVVENFDDLAAERAFLVSEISRLIKQGTSASHICVVARRYAELEDGYEPALASAGMPFERLGKTAPKTDHVRFATMHRVKGLEFPVIFVVGVNQGIVPLTTAETESADPVVRAQALKRERCLFYVAASRARDLLFVSSHGVASSLL